MKNKTKTLFYSYCLIFKLMDISTKHLNVTILYDDKVAKVKRYTLNNDKKSLIIYYRFVNDPRLHSFITYASSNPDFYKTLKALHTPNSYIEL